MKLLRRILLVLLGVLLLAPTVGLYLLASTEAGLRLITSHLGTMGPVTVTAEQVSGSLTGGFKVGSLHIRDRYTDVRITNATGQLRLLPLLLEHRIELSSTQARQVTVQLLRVAASGKGSSNRSLRFMPATFVVEADALHADSADLLLISGKTLHAANVSVAAEVLPQVIRIRGAQLDWEDMHLAVNGNVHASEPIGLDGRVSAEWHPADKPAWRFDTRFDGNLDRLPLKLDIAAPFHAHVDGTLTALTGKWKLAGNGRTDDLDISVFGGGNALGILSARVALSIDGNGFAAKGPVTAPGLNAGPLQVDFHGAYSGHRLTLRDSTVLHQPSGTHAIVHGTVDVVPNGPRLALAGQWTTLQWPLAAAKPAFTSATGQFTIDGIKPWKVNADGQISAAGLADAPASLQGNLGVESFTIEQATLGLFGGTAKVQGEARWHPEENWSISGHMSGLDPALLREDLPGRLDFDFHAYGAPFGDSGSIDFALSHLTGKLRGQAATGSGLFSKPGGRADWRFNQVDLHVGRLRLQLDGSLHAPRDIKFALDADDLSLLDPDARGRISARGRYAGSDAAPLLLFKARGTDFEWKGYSIDTLDADLDVDLTDEGHAQGKVDLAGIHYGGRTVQRATLDLAGTGKAQRVSLAIDAAPLRSVLNAAGAMDGDLWRGNIDSLTVTDDAGLALRLDKATPMALNLQQLELGELCLNDEAAHGCLNGRRDPDGAWNAAFSIQDMPLRAFTAGLMQDIDYAGTINLRGHVAGVLHGLPTGAASGELKQAQLLHTLSNKHIDKVPLGSGSMQAEITATGFSAQLALDADTAGAIKGNLSGERTDGKWQDYPIRGRAEGRTDDLSLLNIFFSDIDKATGHLGASVDISGTLGNPVLAGQGQLSDAAIDIYQSNTALRELSVKASFDATALNISGKSKLGGGMADFSGKLSWHDNDLLGHLHVKGDGLRLVNIPEVRIDASPDLDFELLAGRRIKVTGEVRIPKAKLQPTDLTGVVLKSADEHIVGAIQPDPQQQWNVTSEIKLTLGDDVSINALGLDARLGGNITIRDDGVQATRGSGELNIKPGGTYNRFARKLDIESGQLSFNGGPVDDPGLSLVAKKELTDVTVRVTVRGPLRSRAPKMTFSSEPQYSQTQILSLLAGSSLDSVQSNGAGAGRAELLAQAGGLFVQRFGKNVDIDDVGVESELNGDTSVVLGKSLFSSRLYVSYGISLAEAINTFKARLTLSKGWTLKMESGKARSADLVYTFKKSKKDKAEDPAKEPPKDPK